MSEQAPSNTTYLRQVINGGVIVHSEMAVKLAEIFLAYTYDFEQLDRQRPLVATEHDGKWRVEGSYKLSLGWMITA